MTNNLLNVPLKQTEPINLGEKISEVIKSQFFQPASNFENDLNYLTSLRNSITEISNTSISTISSIDKCYEYYSVLQILETKFPKDSIEFGWFITLYLKPIGPISIRSIKYEILNIIFQIGSIYSKLALNESRHLDEGLKKSCQFFQLSAGCFQIIKTIVTSINSNPNSNLEIPGDFQNSTISCLIELMLAQAQETIWQKAINSDTTKDSVIARLSIQTSEYYSNSLKNAKNSDYIKLDWMNHITIKYYHFLAAAHYRSSIIALNSFQYGEQVAHLRIASDAITKALKFKKYVNEFVLEDLMGLSEIVKTKLRTAEKDNDLIYLKLVPKENDLKPIIGVSMVKPIESEEFTKPLPKDTIFKDLLPYVIIHYAQALRERQDEYLKTSIIEPIQALDQIIIKFLNERNLPSSIDALQQPENIPDAILNHSREIMNLGGINIIENLLKDISNLSYECKHLVQECQNRIDKDKQEDQMLREKEGTTRWNRPDTEKAASIPIAKIQRMNEYLQQAKNGDEVIIQRFNEIREPLEVYMGGLTSLNKYIPNSNYIKLDKNISNIVIELRDYLSQIDSLKTDRINFLHNIEIKNRNNNILPKLIDEYKRNKNQLYDNHGEFKPTKFELIYEDHIKLFNSEISFLYQTKTNQQEIENKIDIINKKFIQEYTTNVNSTLKKRQTALQNLDTSFIKYKEILTNLNEGLKFYNDFISKGNNVLKECQEFLNKRRVESRDLEIEIQRNLQYQNEQNQRSITPDITATGNNHRDEALAPDVQLVSPRTQKSNVWDPNSNIKFG
ncbi:RIM20 [Candida pseudojiufengensis]|uniref:RIM20 n=1 Tax=Candida pseudojiufengensis TaxID=497109 RepID=UPI0022256683|nr:RIM20 [Candida pseudojiufengensis]KAI5960566.1 RIM20 [Candida pseudojiufengensis]